MRILLQHIRSQLYLRSPGNWTANPFEALDFRNSQEAIDYARENRLPEVQIAVSFDLSQFDEVVPLPPVRENPRSQAG